MPRWGNSAGRRIRQKPATEQTDSLATTPGNHKPDSPSTADRAVALAAVRQLPAVDTEEQERRGRLLLLTVKAPTPEIGVAAVEAAATARCLVPFTCWSTDRNAAAAIARFLVWTAYLTGVVDLRRAFRHGNVDRYLLSSGSSAADMPPDF